MGPRGANVRRPPQWIGIALPKVDRPIADLAQAVVLQHNLVIQFERMPVPVSTLPLLAKALDTSIEELIGGDGKRSTKRVPAPKIQQQLERVSQLPRARQRMVSEVLDSLLAQAR